MYSGKFRYYKDLAAEIAGSRYIYKAWLADDKGGNVMEYILTEEKLKEFLELMCVNKRDTLSREFGLKW
jgi:hypothetical protein